jgi:hypothetical protein
MSNLRSLFYFQGRGSKEWLSRLHGWPQRLDFSRLKPFSCLRADGRKTEGESKTLLYDDAVEGSLKHSVWL